MNQAFSPEQSLQLIQTMIEKARRDYSDGSRYFLLWGWTAMTAFIFYGLGTFISGRILQFSPFVIGGITCWIIAIAAAWFDVEYQMLFAAAALLASYIIPGHMLRSMYRTRRQQYAAGQ